jgi:predicted GNAT superfamily acetyltransferase
MECGMMTIRPLTTIDECRRVAALEREIWAYTDAEDVVPPPVLIVSTLRGGILLGGFDDAAQMQGFVYSLPAVKNGQLTQWSHMLGVREVARDAGLGFRLKLAQRDAALAADVNLIEWTFDPLQALNAYFNFSRLGVVVEEYEPNIYGESSSPLHRGSPTDRFVAQWNLREPHVERRIAARGMPLMRDAGVASAPLVNPSSARDLYIAPGRAALDRSDRRLLVEIPGNYDDIQRHDDALAFEWRLASRAIFQAYLSRGYRVVDFFLSREHRRGQYLLARTVGEVANSSE